MIEEENRSFKKILYNCIAQFTTFIFTLMQPVVTLSFVQYKLAVMHFYFRVTHTSVYTAGEEWTLSQAH